MIFVFGSNLAGRHGKGNPIKYSVEVRAIKYGDTVKSNKK